MESKRKLIGGMITTTLLALFILLTGCSMDAGQTVQEGVKVEEAAAEDQSRASTGKYELLVNGKTVLTTTYSKASAVRHCQNYQVQHGKNRTVLGKYNGKVIGYELFWNGKRVGYFPAWSRNKAVSNYNLNLKRYPEKYVLGRFDGYALGDYWWTHVTEMERSLRGKKLSG